MYLLFFLLFFFFSYIMHNNEFLTEHYSSLSEPEEAAGETRCSLTIKFQ